MKWRKSKKPTVVLVEFQGELHQVRVGDFLDMKFTLDANNFGMPGQGGIKFSSRGVLTSSIRIVGLR